MSPVRLKLLLAYDGRPFRCWQSQATGDAVQDCLERAFAKIVGHRIPTHGSGRTDAGVHALGQVAHVDLVKDWPAETVRNALNAYLVPQPVCVLAASVAPERWHSRFSATERRYLYRILNRPSPPALDQGRVWHVKKPLDAEAMHAAAQALVGHHDFTTFRDLACQANSPMKTLDVARVRREADEVILEFASRSFLHRQVRSMTGTLAEVGVGRWKSADVAAALAARDRKACGPVAPAEGLYLTGVSYPLDDPA